MQGISFPGSIDVPKPPMVYDKVVAQIDIKTRIKAPLKMDKETFEVPNNPKSPKTSFIVGSIIKFKYFTRQDLEDSKLEYDRDGFSKEAVDKLDEEEEEDDS